MTLSRRSGLRLLGGAAAAIALAPLLACRRRPQPGEAGLRRVGLLQYLESPPVRATRQALLASLSAQGYGVDRQIQLLQRDAGGRAARSRQLAAELVASRLDLLLAIGTPSLLAAMAEAPRYLPIVFCFCSNPWGAGAGHVLYFELCNIKRNIWFLSLQSLRMWKRRKLFDLGFCIYH